MASDLPDLRSEASGRGSRYSPTLQQLVHYPRGQHLHAADDQSVWHADTHRHVQRRGK